MNIFHPITSNNHHLLMQESQYTDITQQSQLQVEQILTNHVLILHARLLLILGLVAFGTATQLLVFSVICIFFDGAPYYICLTTSIWLLIHATLLLLFIRKHHSRQMLTACIVCTGLSILSCALLFLWTTYLIHAEDEQIRRDNQLSLGLLFSQTIEHSKAGVSPSRDPVHLSHLKPANHIIRNTRMTMYSLHLVFSLIQAACCSAILYILYRNQRSVVDGQISKGYFFSRPAKHQTVLVPITLKQVRGKLNNPNEEEDEEVDSTSVGVQTSGGYVGGAYRADVL